MNKSPGSTAAKEMSAISTIVTAGLVVGVLDIISAFFIFGAIGSSPVRILQSIASGLLGPESFKGGLTTAGLGLVLHFVIALGAAAVFYAASRKLPVLIEHPIVSGLVYGLGVYAFMNLVVLPLSAAKPRYSVYIIVSQLLVHPLLIGIPIALMVRRFSRAAAA